MPDDLQRLVERRLVELGNGKQRLSTRAVEERSGKTVSRSTVANLANGSHRGEVNDETLRGLSLGLDVPLSQLRAAAGRSSRHPLPPFDLPDRHRDLTNYQRRLLVALADQMLAVGSRFRRDEVDGDAAPMKQSPPDHREDSDEEVDASLTTAAEAAGKGEVSPLSPRRRAKLS